MRLQDRKRDKQVLLLTTEYDIDIDSDIDEERHQRQEQFSPLPMEWNAPFLLDGE